MLCGVSCCFVLKLFLNGYDSVSCVCNMLCQYYLCVFTLAYCLFVVAVSSLDIILCCFYVFLYFYRFCLFYQPLENGNKDKLNKTYVLLCVCVCICLCVCLFEAQRCDGHLTGRLVRVCVCVCVCVYMCVCLCTWMFVRRRAIPRGCLCACMNLREAQGCDRHLVDVCCVFVSVCVWGAVLRHTIADAALPSKRRPLAAQLWKALRRGARDGGQPLSHTFRCVRLSRWRVCVCVCFCACACACDRHLVDVCSAFGE